VKLGSNYVDAPMVRPGLYQFTTIAGSNYTILPATIAETENLAANSLSAGDTHQVLTNAAFSNVRGTRFNASAASDFVSYIVSNVVAGSYRVRVVADAGNDRGQFQLACGPVSGTLTSLGTAQDTYSATNLAYLLPLRIGTPTNVISLWTNQLTEFDCGIWQAPSNGNYEFKFTVAGKNAASSGYTLSFDHIKFTPAPAAPPANNPPTDITLANSSVTENQITGTTVGALGTADPDASDTFTYTLVSGVGDTNNASFAITGNSLQAAAVFDCETQNNYSIRVRSTDQGGLSFEKAFTVTVLNTNEAPTDIALSNTNVMENLPAGTIVGNLGTTDPDTGDTFTYSLVPGVGSESNSFFTVTGAVVRVTGPFDGDASNTKCNIRVRSTDAAGLYVEKPFVIEVLNTNEAPLTPVNLAPVDAAANESITPTLQSSTFSDPDIGDTNSASQWLVRRVANNALVFDSGTNTTDKTSVVLPAGALDFATAYNWQMRHEDSYGLWSDYSTPTTFSTLAPTLSLIELGGELRLFWPTNTPGFQLEFAMELPAPIWFLVTPPPVIVDGHNVVTNAHSSEKAFYRLNRP
jgi:hypothetical protein